MGMLVNKDLAEELGLEVTGTTRLGDPSNPEANEADTVVLDSLQIGDALFEEVDAVSWEPPGLGAMGIRGIVGMPVFRHCLVTIDRTGGVIRIEQGALPEPDGGEIVPFVRDAFGVISIPIDVAGVEVNAHLDSGNSGSIGLPRSIEETTPIVEGTRKTGRGMRASGPVEFTIGILDGDVRVGPILMESPEVRFSDLPHGNIGASFLARCSVTIDQVNLRLRITPADAAVPAVAKQQLDRRGRRRLEAAMVPADGRLKVSSVGAGSLGERAGLLVGDVLLEVDGKEVTFADASALTEALSGTAAFTLTVERAGERKDLEVPAGE
jgi:hypothetical protein